MVLATAAAVSCAIAAPAGADVVRVTEVQRSSGPDPQTAPVEVRVARYLATASGAPPAGAAVTGIDELFDVELSPDGGTVLYSGAATDLASDVVAGDEARTVGVFPSTGGPARRFTGPAGRPFALAPTDGEARPPWLTWSPGGDAVVLHAFDAAPGRDAWFAPPRSRRCVVATGRCAPAVSRDETDLPGGGVVRVDAGIVATPGGSRTIDRSDDEASSTERRFTAREGRRFRVTVSVRGRAGATATWTTSGLLRRGAPAYDRAYPSAAGVLVRTSTVRPPDRTPGPFSEVRPEHGRAVIVRADGTVRRLGRLTHDVVGTLPDGRWLLTGGETRPFPRPVAGEPLRTLDAQGRIEPLRSGGRPVSPVWAASTAGVRDSFATQVEVARAGIDGATGLLVLVLRTTTGDDVPGSSPTIALPLDGSAPPRVLPGDPREKATESRSAYLVP